MTCGFAFFDTNIGRCGLAWKSEGLTCVRLPANGAASEARMKADLARHAPGEATSGPPPFVLDAIRRMQAVLEGEREDDLASIPLDMSDVPPFHARVYEVARTIRPGRTMTYGEVATRLGDAGAARAVGQALGKNPFAVVVPCHRVLAAGNKTGGFSAPGGARTKLRMLAIEGAPGVQSSLF